MRNKEPKELVVSPELAHPTKTTRFLNWVVAGALIIAAIGLFIILRWSFASDKILEVHNSPFPARVVSDPSGNTGGIVFLKADYCKNTPLVGELRISYVSASREVFLPLAKEQLPKGCESQEVPIVIPKDLPVDKWKIKFRASYDINPLKKGVSTTFESQQFTVGSQDPI